MKYSNNKIIVVLAGVEQESRLAPELFYPPKIFLQALFLAQVSEFGRH